MASVIPAKYQVEIFLDQVNPLKRPDAVSVCAQVWHDAGSVAWNYAAPEDAADDEAVLIGFGWLLARTPETLCDELRAAVVTANGRGWEVTIVYSELVNVAETVVSYGSRGGRSRHQLRDGKYVRAD